MQRRSLILAAAATSAHAVAERAVRFPLGKDPADTRNQFSAALLQLALQQSGEPQAIVGGDSVNQIRALNDLAAGQLDVALISNLEALPPSLRAVPFPLRQGLLGLRLLVSTADRIDELRKVPDEATLRRQYTLGYGHDWQDRSRLERIGYRLVTASSYRGLFAMLRAHRFDYLSRAISEVTGELARPELNPEGRLAVVPGLALRYPLDDAFVVRADNPRLYQRIHQGLQASLSDGSYWALFDQHYAEAMQFAALAERRIWSIPGYADNPGIEQAQTELLRSRRSGSWR